MDANFLALITRSLTNAPVAGADPARTEEASKLLGELVKRHGKNREQNLRRLSNLLRDGVDTEALKNPFFVALNGSAASRIGPQLFQLLVEGGLRLTPHEAAVAAAGLGKAHLIVKEVAQGLMAWERYFDIAVSSLERIQLDATTPANNKNTTARRI
ncbi:hypothetical protein [Novilysobacter arseniciresistens]|uniref:hypothetical protein n=1 Tax=Novilysobacter arseniciresistens TaxID=1385522 RepID=UPI0012698ACE|nr:hypothetical protein [Lysobacter arseniciresistens]